MQWLLSMGFLALPAKTIGIHDAHITNVNINIIIFTVNAYLRKSCLVLFIVVGFVGILCLLLLPFFGFVTTHAAQSISNALHATSATHITKLQVLLPIKTAASLRCKTYKFFSWDGCGCFVWGVQKCFVDSLHHKL